MSRAHYLELWREAMWHSTDLDERARLTLELGRASVREEGVAAPLAVAITEQRDPPLVLIPLAEAPRRGLHAARTALTQRLGELGATELYVMLTAGGGSHDGVSSQLLAVWAEAVGGSESCWVMPFRWVQAGLEEAEPLLAPDAKATVFSRQLSGLLPPRH